MERLASFGYWLRRRRKALHLTQDELARRVYCSVETIRKIEADARRPSLQIAERLAVALGLAAEEREAFVKVARAERAVDQLDLPEQPIQPPTLDHARTNLPALPTRLIGRARERADIKVLLRRDDVRLVTLTGPGGVGKTCLAIKVAAEFTGDDMEWNAGTQHPGFSDGVWFVALAPIRDPQFVAVAIAQTLRIRESGQESLVKILKAYLRQKRLLLLLDNVEHLLDAAPLIAELLAAAPRLKILATSRAPLRLAGEHEFLVSPLTLPPRQGSGARDQGSGASDPRPSNPDPRTLMQYAAVQLFIERSQAARAGFTFTSANAPAVAEICVRLDGLPLAIELAAARVKLFFPREILMRLERGPGSSLQLLTGGPRDLPARQQTLRNTIDWSYNLLTPEEQALFRWLAVFVGGWTLEAAEIICGDQGSGIRGQGSDEIILIPDPRPLTPIVEQLSSLIDQSLVRQASVDGESRYTMLETIREYALEQLEASAEAESARRRHASYFLALAEEAGPKLYSVEARRWLDRLERELPNLRAATSWAFDHGEPALATRITVALEEFWHARGPFFEGLRWVERALARPTLLAPTVRAPALVLLATMILFGESIDEAAELARAEQALHEALALYRASGDRAGIARTLLLLGIVTYRQGAIDRSVALLEESLALLRELDDQRGSAEVLWWLAFGASRKGQDGQAAALLEEGLRLFQATGWQRGIAMLLLGLGDLAMKQGDYSRAAALHEERRAIEEQIGNQSGVAISIGTLGVIAFAQGAVQRAISLLTRARVFRARVGEEYGMLWTDVWLGYLVAIQGDIPRAREWLNEILALARKLNDQRSQICLIEVCAQLAAAQGQLSRAASLAAAAATLRPSIITYSCPKPFLPDEFWCHERLLTILQDHLGESGFAAAWAEGQALTLEQAITVAQGILDLPESAV